MRMTQERFVLTWRIVALGLLSILTAASSIGAYFFAKMYDMTEYSFRQTVAQEIYNRELERINSDQDVLIIKNTQAIKDHKDESNDLDKRIVRLETILNKQFEFQFDPDERKN